MHQITTDTQNKRTFHLCADAQALASFGSVGQALFGLYSAHVANARIRAVITNVHFFCSPKNARKGKSPYKAATTVPMPRLTRTIGITQHTSVAVLVNKTSHPHLRGFTVFPVLRIVPCFHAAIGESFLFE